MALAKLVSDGTPNGTHVYDADGKEIHGISSVEFWIDAADGLGKMIVEFPYVEAEVLGEIAKYQRGPTTITKEETEINYKVLQSFK